MKETYIDKIRRELDQYQMDDMEKQDIIDDYKNMYEEFAAQGMNTEDIETKLGDPKRIVNDVASGYKRVKTPNPGVKFTALSPFIAIIIFFLGGMLYNAWDIAWLAFLIIPITAITVALFEEKNIEIINGITPFIALIIFLILGLVYDTWHPSWLIFLIIPVIAILLASKSMGILTTITAVSPFVAFTIFLFLGEAGHWVPGWVVFLIIPFFGIFLEENKFKVMFFLLFLIGGIAAYLYLGYETELSWGISLLTFVPLVVYSLLTDLIEIQISVGGKRYRYLFVGSILVYIVLSVLTNNWLYPLIVFMSVPITAIILETKGKEKYIALSPFVTTILFVLVGSLFDAWEYSWLFYLGIPMTAIIFTQD